MSNDKMREEFQAAMPVPEGVYWDEGRNQYMTSTHHVPCVAYRGAWNGWKASRAALAIDLSDLSRCFSPNDCGDWAMWLDDVRIMLQAAGLKVKL